MTSSTDTDTAAGTAVGATRWQAVHAYCQADTDRLVVEGLAPAMAAIKAEGWVEGWFFVRYWHGGPHLRVRLRGCDDGLDQASRVLTRRLAEVLGQIEVETPLQAEAFYAGFRHHGDLPLDEGWHEHGEIVVRDYEPELERYGGALAMPVAEQLFQVSSEIALAVVGATRSEQARSAVALDLFRGLVRGLYPDAAAQIAWLREYATMWRFLDGSVARGSTAIRDAAEVTFVGNAGRLMPSTTTDRMPGVASWQRAVQRVAAWLRGRDDLTASPDAILVSQLHMMANRLGLNASDEFYLAWLASMALAAPAARTDYFVDGVTAADRAYHELSKFRAPLMREQAPQRTGPVERSLEFARGTPVDLPVPEQDGLSRPFLDVLCGRRSHRDGYAGQQPLELADLAALLGYGTGYVAQDGREGTIRGVRAHPSAGMSYASFLRVAAFDVDGLAAGLYEYLPHTHQLQQMGAAPRRAELLDSSPFFFRGGDPAIRADDAPAFLMVGVALGALRPRYGLRALRFALLEMGHLAQNVVLTASALDLSTVTVGGFYDDHLAELAQLDGYADILGYLIPIGRTPQRSGVHPIHKENS